MESCGEMPTIKVNTFVPKGRLQFQIFEREITEAMRAKTRPEIRALFKGTVEGWANKPVFRGTIKSVRGRFIRLLVQPTGPNKDQYSLVSTGSPPHTIRPRFSGRALIYKKGYRAATRPRSLKSRAPGRFGPTIIRKFKVDHPGFEGRDFPQQIVERYTPIFVDDMKKAIAKATSLQVGLLAAETVGALATRGRR